MRHLKIRQLLLIALISCVPFVVKFVPASPQPVPESIASPLLGQGERKGSAPADMIDEKAKAIYDAGVAAAQKLKSLEVIAQMKMGDLDPSMLPPGFGGKFRVVIEFAEGGTKTEMHFRVEQLKDGNPVSALIVDGSKSMLVDFAEKTFVEGGQDPVAIAGPALQAFPSWIIEQRMAASDPVGAAQHKIMSATLVGTETVDDLKCDVVKVVRMVRMGGVIVVGGETIERVGDDSVQEIRINETISFARVDALPRRFSIVMESPGHEEMASMVQTATFSAMMLNPKLDASVFTVAAPEGFRKTEPKESGSMIAGQGPELSVKVGDPAPDFALTSIDGKEVTLASLKGKVILLDFWATWCGPCKASMPLIQKIHDDYKDKGVAVFGVNTFEKKEGAGKKYMEEKKYTYGCLLRGDDLARAYGVSGIPALVVIGKDGKIVFTETGLSDQSGGSLRATIDAALAK